MANKSEYIRTLPDERYVPLLVNDRLDVSIDTRLDCVGIRFENQTSQPLEFRTDTAGPLQLIQPGVSVRNFAQGVHSFYLRNNAANADDGQVYLLFSEEELPQQPDTVPFKNAILANNIRTLSVTDLVLTAVIVPVAAGERFRILGYRVQLSWAIGAGAANGTSDMLARIESPASGVSDIGQIFAECRHTAAAVEQYWGQGDSGFVSLGEPGYTFGPGSDVEIAIGHNTAAGTAPAQLRATGIGEVWGVLEPVSIG